ncbi:hypothetical protein NC653_009795 [Populus alba x Populus x berolinensis]|uniref:Dirigent protein n=1 Tax=Populus alba x Populus x berolinensis TaxID=444605 RepID=A0AAD6R9X6_9ROSI|nr:hypothetical protein NC653_009795 [Populus alba x Populus x berolinensis]
MARLHFYFHTIQSGENQTTMRIAGPAKTMVVGGCGLFRFNRGYSLLKTISFSPKTRNAVVEYNVTVVHFRIFSFSPFLLPSVYLLNMSAAFRKELMILSGNQTNFQSSMYGTNIIQLLSESK